MAARAPKPATFDHNGPTQRDKIAIQDASAYILRLGVVISVVVMFFGLVLALFHNGLTKHEILTHTVSTDWPKLGQSLRRFDGFAFMDLGVLLLVLTPILRVATATLLFAVEEHDRFYTVVTFLVLVMTVSSLLFIS